VRTQPEEQVRLDERRHAVVLAGPLVRALALACAGLVALWLGWPVSPAGAVLLALGALLAVRAVWRWERTHVVVTSEKLFVVHGTLRRRAAAVRLSKVGAVELEQSLAGRMLGYGTVTAGGLEIEYVARPGELTRLLEY
jgi:uncharacterized membrane protein YdbT with pleckstrin-like domain